MYYILWGICKMHRVHLLQKCNFYTFEINEITSFYVTGLFFSILTHLLLLCVCTHVHMYVFLCMWRYRYMNMCVHGSTGTCMCVGEWVMCVRAVWLCHLGAEVTGRRLVCTLRSQRETGGEILTLPFPSSKLPGDALS